MRLLVVEDDRSLAEALRRVLSQEGHVVHVIGDGAEALDLAAANIHDAMILDVMLPGLDGLTVARQATRLGDTYTHSHAHCPRCAS